MSAPASLSADNARPARRGIAFAGKFEISRGVDAPWAEEDYSPEIHAAIDLQDHWAPTSKIASDPLQHQSDECDKRLRRPPLQDWRARGQPSVATPAVMHPYPEAQSPDWFSDPSPMPSADSNNSSEPPPVDLPFFDPTATAARRVSDVFALRHQWRPSTKAGLLALATAIPDADNRARAARAFQDALEQQNWPGFFRSWLRLAPAIDCPKVLELVIELRATWDDSPHFWRYRDRPSFPSKQTASAKGQMSWRRSIVLASLAPHCPIWEILDDELLAEWEELSEPCLGFWSFADYLEVNATGGGEQARWVNQAVRESRCKRALHLQEGCDHLGMGRVGATGSGRICPVVDVEIAQWQHRWGEFRPGLRSVSVPPRAPTITEMNQIEEGD